MSDSESVENVDLTDDNTGENQIHENATQTVIAVDSEDSVTNYVNRLDAHTGDGIRHRAFTCLLFNQQNDLLLAQRSANKRLWDGYWDGTVASHPAKGQSQREATRERLEEELGITPSQYTDLNITDKFSYKRYYLNEGVEWEICAVLKATLQDVSIHRDPNEVDGLLWVPYDDLFENLRYYQQLKFCPWFEIAIRRDNTEPGK
ncbi:MAG: isopentenyl-diphosphate Delta-isomerase [Halobacteriaceae archaeon]